jgi:hypothetical protein
LIVCVVEVFIKPCIISRDFYRPPPTHLFSG